MDFKRPRDRVGPEKRGAQRCISYMRSRGWQCYRLNVSAGIYSTAGFPDYRCMHVEHGKRWIEFKVPEGGLEPTQVKMFSEWAKCDEGVWILHDEGDYHKLFKPANWWEFCMRGRIR